MNTQMIYESLVLTSVDIKYSQDGEYLVDGTPKKVTLSLSFTEARAPTSDIYKSAETVVPTFKGAKPMSG